MELPVWSPRSKSGGVPLVNRKFLDQQEMRRAPVGIMLVDADKAGRIGPSKYNLTASQRLTRPSSASHRFTGAPRLGYILKIAKNNAGVIPAINAAAAGSGGQGGAPFATGDAVEASGSFNRPKSARVVCKTGGGHWTDGMTQGTTIVGVYNRFRMQVPGVATYNIGTASEKNRPHSARVSFGTSARFAGGKPIDGAPKPPATLPDGDRRPSGGGGASVFMSTKAFNGGSSSPRKVNTTSPRAGVTVAAASGGAVNMRVPRPPTKPKTAVVG